MIQIPTLNELYVSIKADLESELTITIPVFGKSFLRALAAVQAAKLKLIYLAVGFVQKNIFIDTADPESMGGTLERFGRVKLGRSPFPAVAGQYTAQVTGTTGAVIPESTTFKSDDTSESPGFLFVLDSEYTLDGTNIITVRALTAGIESQLAVTNTLTATAPISLVDQTITILTEAIEPQAAETTEAYRAKGLAAYQLEPQGGAGSDYRLWSADAQGVAQSYPYALAGNANQINIYVEATIVDSTDGKGTPTATILADVEAAVEDPTVDRPGRKPLGVWQVNYLAITVKTIDITIDGFVDLTSEKQALILTAISNEIDDIRPFIGSIDVIANKNDILDTNKIINNIFDAVPGSTFGTVTLEVDSVPLTTYTFDNGEIPWLDTISYT